jgi:hypothetical protein
MTAFKPTGRCTLCVTTSLGRQIHPLRFRFDRACWLWESAIDVHPVLLPL